MARARIVTIGKAIMELKMPIPSMPSKNGVCESEGDYFFRPGGRGIALSLAVSLFSGESFLCTKMGEDLYGSQLFQLLKDNGVNTRFVSFDKRNQTALSLILEERDGAQRRIAFEGAARSLSQDDIENVFLSMPDGVILVSNLPERLIQYTLFLAAKKNVPVFFMGTAGAEDISYRGLEKMHIFSLDRKIASHITGIEAVSQASCLRCLISLSERVDSRYYILRQPGGGFFLYDGKYSEIVDAHRDSVADEECCEEAFIAALTLEILSGKDISKSAKFASAVSALTATKKGYIDSLPDREEIMEYIKRRGLTV